MCGIGGEIRFDGKEARTELLTRINDTLTPRGPDAEGLYQQGVLGFGHRRLSIIDLSPRANQPMHIAEIGLTTIFNGEIYNYREIQSELKSLGHNFFSSSDTEVVTRAYHQWGPRMVEKLAGMFAFAIAHRDTGEVFLARDRLGIKPLYYSQTPQRILFSSSLPALLHCPDVDTALDPAALHHYMTFHAIVPAPRTILKGIRKVPPAHWMRVDPKGNLTVERYWDASYSRREDRADWTEEQWDEAVLSALRTAVKRRMVADVPVGIFLSGGTDSSVITALMAELAGERLQSFSVGFKDVGKEKGNEFQYSDLVARRFQTVHHRIEVDTRELLENLPDCIRSMTEPMVSHDNIGFYLLSKYASRNVKVVQSGQGADEVFGGYHWYPPMLEATDAVETYRQVFFDYFHDELREVLEPGALGDDASLKFVSEFFRSQDISPIDQALRIDTHVMLVDDPVKRVDNMTMAWGLEARVPFLDHELIELVATMPPHLKINDGGKYLLKKIARRLVPPEVVDRPKGYFPVPQLKYIEGPFLDFVKDILDSRRARERGVFRRAYVDNILTSPREHITRLRGSKLWQIALLESWLQTHGL